MKFELSETELVKLEKFKNDCYSLFEDYKESITFSYQFIPTNLGNVIIVKCSCSILNKPLEFDITDYDNW